MNVRGRIFLILSIALFVFLFSGCNLFGGGTPQTTPTPNAKTTTETSRGTVVSTTQPAGVPTQSQVTWPSTFAGILDQSSLPLTECKSSILVDKVNQNNPVSVWSASCVPPSQTTTTTLNPFFYYRDRVASPYLGILKQGTAINSASFCTGMDQHVLQQPNNGAQTVVYTGQCNTYFVVVSEDTVDPAKIHFFLMMLNGGFRMQYTQNGFLATVYVFNGHLSPFFKVG